MGVLAHVGHWYSELLYVMPVVLAVLWLSFTTWRDKRRLARSDGRGAEPDRIA